MTAKEFHGFCQAGAYALDVLLPFLYLFILQLSEFTQYSLWEVASGITPEQSSLLLDAALSFIAITDIIIYFLFYIIHKLYI